MYSEKTKKCPQCLAEIPKKARKCSHCGSKQPENAFVWLLIILFITGVIIFAVYEPSPQPTTYIPPNTTRTAETAPSEPFVATHYIDPAEFRNGGVRQVNVWQSYENRTKVGELLGTHEVELVDQDTENNYCEVRNEKVEGWISCEWLIDIDK